MKQRTYIAIDLKSFYARGVQGARLDPLDTNLVVADESRTDKTICLAVSPSLKAYGISGRARLFEVVQKVKEVNLRRQRQPRADDSPAPLGTTGRCRRTHLWLWTTWWPRPGWPTILTGARESTASI